MVNKIKNYWFNLDKIDKFLILLLILSFIIRIIFVYNNSLLGWDETVYLNLGHDLSIHPLTYSLINSGWTDFIPSNDIIYGWPNIGFRPPLLPYIYSIFYFIKFDFLIPLIIPLFSVGSILLVYILGKELFNKKVGLYGSILFSLIPINVYCSVRIWSDTVLVFFILLTFISFWIGYEKNNNRYKILFGLFFALSLLVRYTAMWIAPVFIIYFLFRDKSLKFLKNKYLWYSIGLFFVVLIPLFIYSFIYYGNPIGNFIHGFKASTYYGGVQSWNYFFVNFWRIFSIVGLFFISSIVYLLIKKEYLKREVYFLLIFIVFFSTMAMLMQHKEDRYILTIVPAVCLISGLFLSYIKNFKSIILGIVCIVLLISLYNSFIVQLNVNRDSTNQCFINSNKFLSNNSVQKDSLIMTNQSPIVHYYTNKNIISYPNVHNLEEFKGFVNTKYYNKNIYYLFSNYDMPMDSLIKKNLDDGFKKIFECSEKYGYSAIYE